MAIYKRLYFLGIGAYLVMFILSLLFYKERTVFLDMAFNLFYIIGKGNFAIQIFRFGDVLSQMPPWLAVKAGLPVAQVLQLYSAGFVVFYFLAYFICGTVLRRYDLALVILLLNLLFTADTFYWMLSQLPQAIALLLLLFALVSGRQPGAMGPIRWVLVPALLVTIVFFHPLILFVLSFSLLYFLLCNNAAVQKNMAYTIAGLYITGMLVKFIAFRTPYEAHSMSGMKNFITLFPNYFTTFSNARFLSACLTKYCWIPVLFITITAFYVQHKAWHKLLLFICAFIGYLGLVNISYPSAATPAFYIENLYMPLAVFLSLPFVFELLPMLHKKKLALPVFLLIIGTGCIRLYAMHPVYTARLTWQRQLLDKYGERKVIAQTTTADTAALLMTWGAPYELLLLSACERNRPASIVLDPDPLSRLWAGSQPASLVVNYNVVPYRDLNPRYFHFTDTMSIYTIIK